MAHAVIAPVQQKQQQQQRRTAAMQVPNTQALTMLVTTSKLVSARRHESTITLAGTSYTSSASSVEAAMPMQKQSTLRMGPAIMQASTRGVTR
jgi:hypothetical protein